MLLESFSKYHCGIGGIFVEGIEFKVIPSVNQIVDLEQNKKMKDGTNMGGVLKTKLEMDSVEQMIADNKEIIKRSGNNVQIASSVELCLLLFKGILIDNGETLFSLSKVNGKRCHMLPAKAIIYNSSNIKLCNPPTESRFEEVVEILSHQDFRIKCDIETKMLSSDTTYACFLVFKLSKKCHGLQCPVKARDLVPHRKERTKIISFRYPSTVNLDRIKWIPEQREDEWMEVIVWETNVDNMHNDEYVPMDLKLTCFEGNMSGLIVYGIDFRPTTSFFMMKLFENMVVSIPETTFPLILSAVPLPLMRLLSGPPNISWTSSSASSDPICRIPPPRVLGSLNTEFWSGSP
ncbi:unnamed protein product [Lactuca virosa]|uniref:Uncharacterized protein n=1 Tax=Lactuca virosa TaxID=75947 RepID=A0AAU9N1G4_9ASTR|nr:unnamed protein product [Lactuca virosa]